MNAAMVWTTAAGVLTILAMSATTWGRRTRRFAAATQSSARGDV